jgi:putative heme iron utilization protein
MGQAEYVRRLLRRQRYGVISTHSQNMPGYPYGSFVEYVADQLGRPVMLISALAEHTHNIHYHPKVTLAAHEPADNVLASPRCTYLGEAKLVSDPEVPACRARYLRYLPHVAEYLALDFAFYRIEPHRIRSVPGFGAAHWVSAGDYLPVSSHIAENEEGILEHMNADHTEALRAYCRVRAQVEARDVVMVGIDCDGFDVRAEGRLVRIDFETAVLNAEQARDALVKLAHECRG